MKNSVFVCILASLFLASGLVQADPGFRNELRYYETEEEMDPTKPTINYRQPLLQIINHSNDESSKLSVQFDVQDRVKTSGDVSLRPGGHFMYIGKVGRKVSNIKVSYDDWHTKGATIKCPEVFFLGKVNSLHIHPEWGQCYVIAN